MQVCARTGTVLGRCWQHWPRTGPVRACLQGSGFCYGCSKAGFFSVAGMLHHKLQATRAHALLELTPEEIQPVVEEIQPVVVTPEPVLVEGNVYTCIYFCVRQHQFYNLFVHYTL